MSWCNEGYAFCVAKIRSALTCFEIVGNFATVE